MSVIDMNSFADLKVWTDAHKLPFLDAPQTADGSPSHMLLRFDRLSGTSEAFIVGPSSWDRIGTGYGRQYDDEDIAQEIEMYKYQLHHGDFNSALRAVFGALYNLE